jgi:ATP-binding cassette subfamily C protein CydD
MRNSKKNQDSRWLTENGQQAENTIRLSAMYKILSFLSQIVQWVGLSLLAQLLINKLVHRTLSASFFWLPTNNFTLAMALLLAGVALNSLFNWLDNRQNAKGIAEASDFRAQRLLPILFPSNFSLHRIDPAEGAGDLMERLTEIATYQVNSKAMGLYARVAMTIIVGLVVLVHWPAAILLLLATAVIPVNMWIAGKLAQEGQDTYLSQLNDLSAKILDSFLGLNTLKRFRGLVKRRSVIQAASDELTVTNYNILKRAFISGMVMDVVVTFSIAVVATYVGFNLMGYWGVPGTHLTLVEGLFVLLLSPMYFTPFREMASAFHDKERANASVRLLDGLPDVDSQPHVQPTWQLTQAPAVALQNVSFQYDDTTTVLTDLSAKVQSEQTIALIGPSGVGKTTMLNIISGVLQPNSGMVSWQHDDETYTPEVEETTWVGQHFLLIQRTLRENLALANPEASDEELVAALDVAQLSSWFANLSDGLETVLGYQNVQPSAGEQKRLAIARAVVKNSRIWFLDEPTAHLDAENAALVAAAIKAATSSATVFISTHEPVVTAISDGVWQLRGNGKVEVMR